LLHKKKSLLANSSEDETGGDKNIMIINKFDENNDGIKVDL
jgi:hypothetical protein